MCTSQGDSAACLRTFQTQASCATHKRAREPATSAEYQACCSGGQTGCSAVVGLGDRYLKEKALSWAPKELSNQKNYIGCFIKALGDRPVVDYGKADVVKFKEGLLNSGKSPTTINKYLQKLSLLFNWLVNHQEDRQSLRRIEAAASQGGELTKWIHSGRTSQVYRVG